MVRKGRFIIMENQIQLKEENKVIVKEKASIEEMFRIATALSKADIIPTNYQNKAANCYIALDMANRLGANPMMIMQNLYIVNGHPAWSSQFIIAMINQSKKFEPLRFKLSGEGDNRSCVCYTTDKKGQLCESPAVSVAMAKREGWYQKNGSKWQTMPDIMLRYRAASFFGKFYCPELMMGIQTEEEIIDITENDFEVVNNKVEAEANKGDIIGSNNETTNYTQKEEKTIVNENTNEKIENESVPY